MKILVLGGCGAMGTESTKDLARYSDFEEIAVADINQANAQKLCDELGGGRMKAIATDVTDVAGLTKLFGGYDVVLNCTSYAFGLGITEAAIAARRPLLDLGGLYNTPKQLALDDKAREAGVSIILGMGATPGVTNLMAKAGSTHMDQVREIHVHFATFRRLAPSPGLLDTVLDEFSPSTTRFFYDHGKFVEVPPFEGEKEVEFMPPVGRIKTYYVPHSETHTMPRFFPGVERVDVRGTWRPEIMEALRHYNEVGLLSIDPIPVKGAEIAPKQFLRAHFLANENPNDLKEYCFYVNVEVVGRKGEADVVATYNLSHPMRDQWGVTCTAKITGIPASIGAMRVARGEVSRKGVLAPEAAFDPWSFFEELSQRQVLVHEKVVSQRRFAAAPVKVAAG